MRTTLLTETQIGAEERASEPLPHKASEELEKKVQTELEEWASKVHKDAVEAASGMVGELKLTGKEGLEARLKQISDEVTPKAQEHQHQEHEEKPN